MNKKMQMVKLILSPIFEPNYLTKITTSTSLIVKVKSNTGSKQFLK